MTEAIHWYTPLIAWYTRSLLEGGYPLVILLMAIESSIVPLPSELIIPPAACLAYSHQGGMSLVGIVVAGAVGSWIGAALMYAASRIAGRPLLVRYGKYFFVPPPKLEAAENWSRHFGSAGVFVSRLLPVIRHLIGIPSGLVRFNFARYSLFTVAGSLTWCAVLSAVGVAAGNNAKLMSGDLKTVTVWLGAALVALGALYYFFVYRFSRAKA